MTAVTIIACVLVLQIHVLKCCCKLVTVVLEYKAGGASGLVADEEFNIVVLVDGLDNVMNDFL